MRRRIIGMLAAAALAFGAVAASSPAAAEPIANKAYVALGDSYASGNGLQPYADPDCLRSDKAYPSILAAGFPSSASYACSGATTVDVSLQLGAAVGTGDLGPHTRVVTLTVGINNADWQGVLAACSSAGTPQACAMQYDAAVAAMQQVPGHIVGLLANITTIAPSATVLVTGYPLVFGTDVRGQCAVGVFERSPVKFTVDQTRFVNAAIQSPDPTNPQIPPGINDLIRGAVGFFSLNPNVVYVDLTAGFANRGLCGSGGAWISGLIAGAPVKDRGFHPTVSGHRGIADIIRAELAS